MKNKIFNRIKHKLKCLFTRAGWYGDYKTWSDATRHATGYDQYSILDKVKNATLKVINNEAVYERDSVLFDQIQYSWPLLSSLMWIAAMNKGKLNIMDFGGSLGSSYFQNKIFLNSLDDVTWNIVEQPNFVLLGKELFEDDRLKFYYSIDECIRLQSQRPQLIMISCTIQYLKEPYILLKELTSHKIPFFFIDNTPFNYDASDRLTIQKVHPSIYEASYPCWLLDYNKVLSTVTQHYSIISEHTNDLYIYVDGRKIQYRGFLAKHKSLD